MEKISKISFVLISFFFALIFSLICINSNIIEATLLNHNSVNTNLPIEQKLDIYAESYVRKQNQCKTSLCEYELVDKNNHKIIEETFNKISIGLDNQLIVKNNSKTGVIDISGEYIIPAEYKSIRTIYNHNLYLATKYNDDTNKYTDILFKKNGEKLLQAAFIQTTNKYYITQDENRHYVFYDLNLKKFFECTANSTPQIIGDKYVGIHNNRKYQITDFKNNIIIPFSSGYNNISLLFSNNNKTYFLVYKNSRYGVVDNNNNIVLPVIFNSINVSTVGTQEITSNIIIDDTTKWAKFDKNFNFIEIKISNDNKQYLTENEYKEIRTKEINTNSITPGIKFPPSPPKNVVLYELDFQNKETNDKHTKLICKEQTSYFCNLSPNGISAKYNGRENYYVADKEIEKGKYYLEFQINSNQNEISNSTKFALIYFPEYRIPEDNQRYKDAWKYNKTDVEISNYAENKNIIGVAIDLDNNKIYLSVNGEWKANPYNPEEGIKIKNRYKSLYPAFSISGYNEIITVNFGKMPFRYRIPDGYQPIDIVKKEL